MVQMLSMISMNSTNHLRRLLVKELSSAEHRTVQEMFDRLEFFWVHCMTAT